MQCYYLSYFLINYHFAYSQTVDLKNEDRFWLLSPWILEAFSLPSSCLKEQVITVLPTCTAIF